MTRVPRRSVSVLARRSPGLFARRKAQKHKVVLESVTREKKKLRSVISFEAKAPPGYTFISAGDPHFTTTCKERCRRDGFKVYAVSTTPHMHTHGLSQHVHRIGYHFPSAVVADVCINRGLYLTAAGKAVSLYGMGSEAGRKHTDTISQITINTEARDVLKDLFPNIPNNDLNQIIKTAFQKGQRKVGTAAELPLARRAQLAVVAHIRHIYTDYDRLLKSTSFHEARSTVEQPTLAKLVEWRGDDENGKTVLEDVFREVIVISDDEDSDVEAEPPPMHGRDTSVEVISSNPIVEELPMRPVNTGGRALRGAQVESSEDELAPGFRLIKAVPKKNKIDRRGFSRYQAWDRAINRYRNMATTGSGAQPSAHPTGQTLLDHAGHGRGAPPRRPFETRHPVAPVVSSNQAAVKSNFNRPTLNPVAEHRPYEPYPQAGLPNKRRNAPLPPKPPNPAPMKRTTVPEPVRYHPEDPSNVPVFVSGPKEPSGKNRHNLKPLPPPPAHLHNRNMNPEDRILPSIESPLAVEIKRPMSDHMEHLAKRMSGAFTFRSLTPHRQNPQGYSNRASPQETAQDHISKRRRVAYHEPVPMEKHMPLGGSTALRTYPGNQYATAGQPSVQDDPHVRRRYVAPVEPHHTTHDEPAIAQDTGIYTSRYEREGQNSADRGPIGVYDGQPFSYNRRDDFYTTHHKSPGQSRIGPDQIYAVAAGIGRATVTQPHFLEPTEPQVAHNTLDNISNEYRAPEATGPRLEPAWRSKDPMPYAGAEKQRLYADGFVRHVEPRGPATSDYRPPPRLPSSQLVASPPQSAFINPRGIETRRVHPDNRMSVPPGGHAYLNSPSKAPLRQYPVISDQGARLHDRRLPQTPPPVYYDGRQPNHAHNPSRSTYDYHQPRDPVRDEHRAPAYVTTAEDARFPRPEGRHAVVIVD